MAKDSGQFEQLSAFLDGELSDAERARVESLLARDPEASAMLAELRRISSAVHSLPRRSAPDGFAESVMSRIERETLLGEPKMVSGSRHSAWRWVRPWAVAASLMIAGTLTWLMAPQMAFHGSVSVETAPELRRTLAMKPEQTPTGGVVANKELPGAPVRPGFANKQDRVTDTTKPDDKSPPEMMIALDYNNHRRGPLETNAPHSTDDRGVAGTAPQPDTVILDRETTEAAPSRSTASITEANSGARLTGKAVDVAGADSDEYESDGRSELSPPASAMPNRSEKNGDESAVAGTMGIELARCANDDDPLAAGRRYQNRLEVQCDDPALVDRLSQVIETDVMRQQASTPVARFNRHANRKVQAGRNAESRDRSIEPSRRNAGESNADLDASTDPAPPAPDGELQVIVLKGPRDQVAGVLKSMQSCVESSRTDVTWVANDDVLPQSRMVEESLERFKTEASPGANTTHEDDHRDSFQDAGFTGEGETREMSDGSDEWKAGASLNEQPGGAVVDGGKKRDAEGPPAVAAAEPSSGAGPRRIGSSSARGGASPTSSERDVSSGQGGTASRPYAGGDRKSSEAGRPVADPSNHRQDESSSKDSGVGQLQKSKLSVPPPEDAPLDKTKSPASPDDTLRPDRVLSQSEGAFEGPPSSCRNDSGGRTLVDSRSPTPRNHVELPAVSQPAADPNEFISLAITLRTHRNLLRRNENATPNRLAPAEGTAASSTERLKSSSQPATTSPAASQPAMLGKPRG